ncbi:hypothetical protein GCM10010168_63950 [Actinoplanes ianthinogenes]|uniref:Uncharacterized protein n=1 Tax=Actinoplanes ianthinogenes TaxID=122358 RepID=A0ABM7LJC6_9ACTN|nr:hypothetical protein Aiant_00140 [Actinoplanes ianthinogenes]GGR36666.1 hypothetical protein GCM10010168_63950 [Actinoplanes ianthinogenes]
MPSHAGAALAFPIRPAAGLGTAELTAGGLAAGGRVLAGAGGDDADRGGGPAEQPATTPQASRAVSSRRTRPGVMISFAMSSLPAGLVEPVCQRGAPVPGPEGPGARNGPAGAADIARSARPETPGRA